LSPNPPNLIVLGGPNGAGKSSVAPHLLRGDLEVTEFVNADVIAKDLSGPNEESIAIAAGRMMLERIAERMNHRASLAFESTLASRSLAGILRTARTDGYRVGVVFLWLSSDDVAVQRVRDRVSRGGHSVPEPIVRRRYRRGIENFFRIYMPLADAWRFYDNSDVSGPRLVAHGESRYPEPCEEIFDGTIWRAARPRE
jgi:predicted ABC-type ATPase